MQLTPGGAVLYKEFSRIVNEVDDIVDKAKHIEIGQSGTLHLGVLETQRSENFLPNTLMQLREQHPNIKVDIVSGTFKQLREYVLSGEIDIAPEISHGGYNAIIHLCEESNFTPRDIQISNSIQDQLLKVESGLGYAILDENCISTSNHAVVNIPIEHAQQQLLVAVWRRDNFNPIISIFMNYLAKNGNTEL